MPDAPGKEIRIQSSVETRLAATVQMKNKDFSFYKNPNQEVEVCP